MLLSEIRFDGGANILTKSAPQQYQVATLIDQRINSAVIVGANNPLSQSREIVFDRWYSLSERMPVSQNIVRRSA